MAWAYSRRTSSMSAPASAERRRADLAREQLLHLQLVQRAHVRRRHRAHVEAEEQRRLALVAHTVGVGDARRKLVDALAEEHHAEPRQLDARVLDHAAARVGELHREERRLRLPLEDAAEPPLAGARLVGDEHRGVRPLGVP